jgi:hypothetical protein
MLKFKKTGAFFIDNVEAKKVSYLRKLKSINKNGIFKVTSNRYSIIMQSNIMMYIKQCNQVQMTLTSKSIDTKVICLLDLLQ